MGQLTHQVEEGHHGAHMVHDQLEARRQRQQTFDRSQCGPHKAFLDRCEGPDGQVVWPTEEEEAEKEEVRRPAELQEQEVDSQSEARHRDGSTGGEVSK